MRQIGLIAAIAILVSNMVGTGVFTSLGLQVAATHTGFALLALWVLGGLLALCGAACYSELGAAMPRSGGEYVYLGQTFHPFVGFLGGWVSLTVGFAAPIALAGIAFGHYAAVFLPLSPRQASLVAIVALTLIHAASLRLARWFQVGVTTLVVLLIITFIITAIGYAHPVAIGFAPTRLALGEIAQPEFAVSLIYVSYAYSGWNAASYVAGEIADPERNIPRALVLGTALVTILYVLLNWAFLRTVPMGQLTGVVEVAALSATQMFGSLGGRAMSGVIAIVMIGSMSGFVLAGSRVTQAIVADSPKLHRVAARTRGGVPRRAILLQTGLTLALLLTNAFEAVLTYAGFTLELGTLLAIVALIVRRRRGIAGPVRTWGYPATALVYVAISGWTLAFVIVQRPLESLAGVVTLAVGAIIYFVSR